MSYGSVFFFFLHTVPWILTHPDSCNTPCNQDTEQFFHPENLPHVISLQSLTDPTSNPWQPLICFWPHHFEFLSILYKWHDIVWDFFLVSIVPLRYIQGGACINSWFLYLWLSSVLLFGPTKVYSSMQNAWVHFQFSEIINWASINICMQIFCVVIRFHFSRVNAQEWNY